jgi:ATP-binding cassette, subfamily B, bacterial
MPFPLKFPKKKSAPIPENQQPPNCADTPEKDDDYKKINASEFVNYTKWAMKLLFSVDPLNSSVYFVIKFITQYGDLVNAYIMARITDVLVRIATVPGTNYTELYPLVGAQIAFNVSEGILKLISMHSILKIRFFSRIKLKQKLYYKIKDLGIQTLEQPEIANKMSRADETIFSIVSYFTEATNILAKVVKLFSTTLIIVKFLPGFSLLVIFAYIPYILLDKKMRFMLYKFDYETTEGRRMANASAGKLTASNTLPEVNINGSFSFFDKKYMDFFTWGGNMQLQIYKTWRSLSFIYNIFLDSIMIFGFFLIVKKLMNKLISIGDVTFWLRILGTFKSLVGDVTQQINDLFEFSLRLKDSYLLFHTTPAFQDGTIEISKLTAGPAIEFKDVSFSYPGSADALRQDRRASSFAPLAGDSIPVARPQGIVSQSKKLVLKNLNLTIGAREKIAIVGHNGAGKTTLVKLLCRFYQPCEGNILINGTNLSDIKIDSFYKNIGVLWQDYNRYGHLTAKENIYLGDPVSPVDEERIVEAAKAADALKFIEDYPAKFDQILSENFKKGIRPSTGQWQKIAIARFFYRNSPLVIFDEPTASIDPVSEYNIFNKIYEFFNGKTVIIISHRFSTVRNADRIIVMNEGEMVEQGTHKELMAIEKGYYKTAFNLQAEGYKE